MKEKSKVIKFDFPLYDTIPSDLTDITAVYLRVSTDMQAQEGYGLDVQYNAIKRYVMAYEIETPVIFVDDGYTGMNDDRPAFKKMQKLMKEGRVKFIITYGLDRIGRTQMLILKFLKEDCVKADCDFFAVKDNIDSRSKQTYGILISILSIFAEMDHDSIVTKLFLGRKQRAIEGFWKGGGIPPFGYYYDKETKNLSVDVEKAQIVKKIYELYITNEYSPRQIADIFKLSGDAVVFNILKNRTYLGEITFCGEQYKGLHQRIIDDETFDLAQEVMQKRSSVKSESNYLLSSLVRCGNCGAKMRYMMQGRKTNRKLKLLCYSKYKIIGKEYLIKDPDCPNHVYDAKEVENIVVKGIMDFAIRYSKAKRAKSIDSNGIIEGLKMTLKERQEEYSRLIRAYAKLGDENILDEAEAVKADIGRIERKIKAEEEAQAESKKLSERSKMLCTLPDTWDKMTDKERQKIVRSIIKEVVLTDGSAEIYLVEDKCEELIKSDKLNKKTDG